MKLSHGLAAIGLTFAAMTAQAEISGTVGVFSDYNWRGVTQTGQDPALQGSVDYAHDSGFYAGVWASNVDFGPGSDANIETDLYLGFSGGETITWDVGGIYYLYPEESDFNFWEIYAGLGWEWLSTKISWSNDFANLDESAIYLEANGEWELPANFGLNAHVGYSDGNGIREAYSARDSFGSIVKKVDNYFDWSVGVTYTLGHFDFGLKYADGSDLETLDGTSNDIFSSEGVAIFSIETSFPWSNEE